MKSIVFFILVLMIILFSYALVLLFPSNTFLNDKLLGGNKVYLNNIVYLEKNKAIIKVVYIDSNKEKINLTYPVIKNGDSYKIENKYNLYNFINFNNVLYKIDILKYNDENVKEEFKKKLDVNSLVGYFDKNNNNFYIFGHNGTNGINGGALFYLLNKGDTLQLINSIININKNFKIIERKIFTKKDFINNFVESKDIFSQKNKIYLITCYPNYSSTKRLVLVLDKID